MEQQMKIQLYKYIRDSLGFNRNKKFMESLGLEYEKETKACDELFKLSSNFDNTKTQYRYVISDDNHGLKIYVTVADKHFLVSSWNVLHKAAVFSLNTLITSNKIKLYDCNFNTTTRKFITKNSKGEIPYLAFEPFYEYWYKHYDMKTGENGLFSIGQHRLIRIKPSAQCYHMNYIDKNPSPNLGVVANDHYLVRELGMNRDLLSADTNLLNSHKIDIQNARTLYNILSDFDTLVPTNIGMENFCILRCMGFNCLAYASSGAIYGEGNKVIVYLTGKVQQAEYKVASVKDITFKTDGKNYIPYIPDFNEKVYVHGIPSITPNDVEKYLDKTGNNVTEFIKDIDRLPNDWDDWQKACYKLLKVTHEKNKECWGYAPGFKNRVIWISAILDELKVRNEINKLTYLYYTKYENVDASYIALDVLLKEHNIPYKEWLTTSPIDFIVKQRDCVNYKEAQPNEHNIMAPPAIINWVHNHKSFNFIEIIIRALKTSYGSNCTTTRRS